MCSQVHTSVHTFQMGVRGGLEKDRGSQALHLPFVAHTTSSPTHPTPPPAPSCSPLRVTFRIPHSSAAPVVALLRKLPPSACLVSSQAPEFQQHIRDTQAQGPPQRKVSM